MANVVIKPEPIYVSSSNTVGVYDYDDFAMGGQAVIPSYSSSFVWWDENYLLGSSGFDVSTMSSGYTMLTYLTLGTDVTTATDRTIFSTWDNSGNQRGTVLRVDLSGKVDYFSSELGTGISVRVTTTTSLPNSGTLVGVTHEPAGGAADGVVTITFDGVAQPLTTVTDTGDYNIYGSAKDLTIGAFYSSGVAARYFRGFINQFAITSDKLNAASILSIYNGGDIKRFETNVSNLLINADFTNAVYTTKYTVPDTVSGNDFVQAGGTAALRTSVKNDALSPYSYSYDLGNYPMDGSNFYQFDNQAGAAFAFTSNLEFTIDHTGTFDPDRNSCEVLSKGSYDISSQELWVRFDNYDWNTSADVMSHGGISIIDDRNDKTFAMFTHRVISDLGKLGNYRVLVADKGVQVDLESTIAKGKDVFIKIDGTTISFWYNNAGTLTQIWSNQTLDIGNSVRIKLHARDYNAYAAPETYGTDQIKVYRSTPTDL